MAGYQGFKEPNETNFPFGLIVTIGVFTLAGISMAGSFGGVVGFLFQGAILCAFGLIIYSTVIKYQNGEHDEELSE